MPKKTAKLTVVPISARSKLRVNSLADVIQERIQQFVDDSPGCVSHAEIVGCLDMAKDRFK